MPSAVFFDYGAEGRVLFGNEAISAYVEQTDGRLMRELAELVSHAREPEKVKRLMTVPRRRLGYRLAFAVEDAKIALSAEERAPLPLTFLEPGLAVTATRVDFDRAIKA